MIVFNWTDKVDGLDEILAKDINLMASTISKVISELGDKQNKTDEALNTENKTVVGAVNEVFNEVTDNKKDIDSLTSALRETQDRVDELEASGGSGSAGGYTFRGFFETILLDKDVFDSHKCNDVFVVDDGFFLVDILFEPGDNLVRTDNTREYTEDFETSADKKFLYAYGNEYRIISYSDTDNLIVNLNYLFRMSDMINTQQDEIEGNSNRIIALETQIGDINTALETALNGGVS